MKAFAKALVTPTIAELRHQRRLTRGECQRLLNYQRMAAATARNQELAW